jgi:riboflavin kinase/FMN adenylyltransferase
VKYKGIVQKGGEFGRRLGFPTANIPLEDTKVSGIFAATVRVEDKEYGAAVYADQRNKVLESHLLDFSGDLYGKEIIVELHEKIRNDRRFESANEAREAIADDVQKAREYHRVR